MHGPRRGVTSGRPHRDRLRSPPLALLGGLLLCGCAAAVRGGAPPRLPPGLADSVRAERVAEGVRLYTLVDTAAPWRAYVLDVDARCAAVRAVKGGATAVGRTTTSALLAALPAGARAIAAINADFFLFAPPGVPTNLHVQGGVLLAGPSAKPVFAFDGRRRYALDSLHAEGSVTGRGGSLPLRRWNRPGSGATGVLDARWGVPLDSTLRRTVVRRLEPVEVSAGPGPTVSGRYRVRAATAGDTLARGDTLLLHVAGEALPPPDGDTVRLAIGLVGSRWPIREAVGGRPLLVVDSAVAGDVETEGNAAFRGPNPRSAVGMNRAGTRLWYVVVDGRRPAYSMGMTLRQVAELMRALGASRALNLDGGGSSALALRDPATGTVRLVNRPSDPKERPVGNALAVLATCP